MPAKKVSPSAKADAGSKSAKALASATPVKEKEVGAKEPGNKQVPGKGAAANKPGAKDAAAKDVAAVVATSSPTAKAGKPPASRASATVSSADAKPTGSIGKAAVTAKDAVTPTQPTKAKMKQDASTKSSKTDKSNIVPKSNARTVALTDSSPSLFTGPIHGIPPYQPKPGEEYMSESQIDHFRRILLNWKRELMEEVDRTIHHLRDEATNFPDPNDRATQESEFGLELRARDRERKLLKKIDAALERLDDGSYGYCEETGEEIGLRRLEARPIATLCLEAQERHELVERHYGEREDRFR